MDPTYRSGIYSIIHTASGKVYVGSATRSIRKRWQDHRRELPLNIHRNKRLQHAWNKYGHDAFIFAVIESCAAEECLVREQFHIDRLKSADDEFGYNINPTAGSQLGSKRSPEICAKFAILRKREANIRVGKKMSPECRLVFAENARQMAARNRQKYIPKTKATIPQELLNKVPQVRRYTPKLRGVLKSESHKRKIGEAHRRLWAEKREQMLLHKRAGDARRTAEAKAAKSAKHSAYKTAYWTKWRAERGRTLTFAQIQKLNQARIITGEPALNYPFAAISLEHPLATATGKQVELATSGG